MCRGSKGGASNWGSGFLPSEFQGTALRAKGSPILNLNRPAGINDERQRRMLDIFLRKKSRFTDGFLTAYNLFHSYARVRLWDAGKTSAIAGVTPRGLARISHTRLSKDSPLFAYVRCSQCLRA